MFPIRVSKVPTLSVQCKPKLIDSKVIYHRERFLVRTDAGWEYYLARAESIPRKADPNRKYIKFEKTPPIIMEGFFAFRSKFYPVSFRDLLRGQINVRRTNALNADQLERFFNAGEPDPVGESSEQPESSGTTGHEEEAIDMALPEYLRTLQLIHDPEEEWGIP